MSDTRSFSQFCLEGTYLCCLTFSVLICVHLCFMSVSGPRGSLMAVSVVRVVFEHHSSFFLGLFLWLCFFARSGEFALISSFDLQRLVFSFLFLSFSMYHVLLFTIAIFMPACDTCSREGKLILFAEHCLLGGSLDECSEIIYSQQWSQLCPGGEALRGRGYLDINEHFACYTKANSHGFYILSVIRVSFLLFTDRGFFVFQMQFFVLCAVS